MRWHVLAPSFNQKRVLLRFALFPTKIDKTWIWFERYWQWQKSSGNYYFWNANRDLFENVTREKAKEINSKIKWERV